MLPALCMGFKDFWATKNTRVYKRGCFCLLQITKQAEFRHHQKVCL